MVRRARLASAHPARWLALCLILAAACGGSSSGGGDDEPIPDAGPGGQLDGLVTLTVTPSNVTLTADGDTPAVQAFTVAGGFQDGSTRDVTALVAFTVEDSDLGRFQAASFTTSNNRGGRSVVRARAGNVVGIATLTVVIRQRHSDPGATDLPADPSGPFGGPADAARAPSLVYPSTGVLLPPNLGRLEVHFTKHASNDLFAIDFKNEITDVTVFTRCLVPLNGGCIYRPDADVWRWIADTNRGDSNGLQITVRGTNTAGTGVGTSGSVQVAFSQDDIKGGIYYWVTGRIVNGQREEGGSIMRFDFAGAQTDAERFIDPLLTGLLPTGATAPPCGVGCHALSRDGKKLIAAAGSGSTDGRMAVVSIEQGEMLAYPRSGVDLKSVAFSTWSPDGSQFAATFGNGGNPAANPPVPAPAGFVSYDINVFNGETGAFVETIDTDATITSPVVHPEWAPDGKSIAYTKVGVRAQTSVSTAQLIQRTGISLVRRENDAWTAPVTLFAGAAGKAACYPGFSPTSDLLAFGRSACPGTTDDNRCDCYDDPGAAVWIMEPKANATPVELAKANTGGVSDIPAGAPAGTPPPKVQASYPKWSPFTFRRTDEQGTRLQWLTFSSKRNYGLYTPQQGQTLIWMAAVDPDAALAGVDPSYPAFVLPFQDLSTSNHTAQWAERVIPDVD